LYSIRSSVSIPCSEFWLFRLLFRFLIRRGAWCFNSLFGILAVQTVETGWESAGLSRVSIPCSEFWLFRPDVADGLLCEIAAVSIPCSEFWLFRLVSLTRVGDHLHCFNSLFGILAVQTDDCQDRRGYNHHVSIPCSEFWLFRLFRLYSDGRLASLVSIPCSEFWLFRQFAKRLIYQHAIMFQFPVRNSGCSD